MLSSAIACARISSAPGHAIVSIELLLALLAMLITAGVFLRHQRARPIPPARTLYGLAGLYVALAVAVPVGILAAQGHGLLVGEVCAPAGLVTVVIAVALCVAVPLLLAQVMTTAARAELAETVSAKGTADPRRDRTVLGKCLQHLVDGTAPDQRTQQQASDLLEAHGAALTDMLQHEARDHLASDWLQARRVLTLVTPSVRRGE